MRNITESGTNRVLPLLAGALLLLLMASCAPKDRHLRDSLIWRRQVTLKPGEFPWSHSEHDKSTVLARVNGVAIRQKSLDLFMKKNPELTRDQAFTELVGQELAAQKAYNTGLTLDKEIQWRIEQRTVKLLLKEKFEKEISTDDVPRQWLGVAWHRRRGNRYQHPDGFYMIALSVACCSRFPEGVTCMDPPEPTSGAENSGPVFLNFVPCLDELDKRTIRFVEHIRHRWGPHLYTEADFKALLKFYRLQPFAMKAQRYHAWYDFSLKDQKKARYQRYDWPFTRAFTRMNSGELSKVVSSSGAVHLIRLESHFDKQNLTLDQVTPQLRKFLYPTYQSWAADKFLKKDLPGLYETTFNDKPLSLLRQVF